jgi:hypothetical protein
MTNQAIRSDVLPEALAVALINAEFDQVKTHARYKYLEAFVDRDARSPAQTLTRSDVQEYLEATYPDLEFNSRTTGNTALQDLVEAGFLEYKDQTQTYQYYLVWGGADGSEGAQCGSTGETAMADGSDDDGSVSVSGQGTALRGTGTVASGEGDQTSAAASTGSATTDSAPTGWVPSVRNLSQSRVGAWATLFVLFAGGSVAFITVLLVRLAVPSPVVTGSAAVAWGLLSLALAAGVVLGLLPLKRLSVAGQIYR